MSKSKIVDKALQLARRGLPVFPCLPDKSPATTNGYKAASKDPEQVMSWDWRDRLIGVPTGSRSGLAVLDIDFRHGGDVWLEAHKKRLWARVHSTRSGGLHVLYRHQEGLRNSAGLIAPGVDVRGEGGYIIWWPSHGCVVIDFLPLDGLPPWPEWLITPKRECRYTSKPGQVIGDPFQVAVLTKFVRESREGERNNRLFWAACRLAEMTFERSNHLANAAVKLRDAALAVGLSGQEAERTIESAFSTKG